MKPNNKRIVKKYIEKAVNKGNVKLIPQFVSSDNVEIYNNKGYTIGIEGAKEHITGMRNTYPDLKLSIDLQTEEGNGLLPGYTSRESPSFICTENWCLDFFTIVQLCQ